jgi:hypothetical protein
VDLTPTSFQTVGKIHAVSQDPRQQSDCRLPGFGPLIGGLSWLIWTNTAGSCPPEIGLLHHSLWLVIAAFPYA